MARLFLTFRDETISNHTLSPESEIIIGRDAGCHIVIDHPSASGRHAKVRQNEKGLRITDLRSTNGTFVNDDKIVDCELGHQDWIHIGKHVLIVDLYETLSIEATTQMLSLGSSGALDAQGTIMLDIESGQNQTKWGSLDYLNFLSIDQPDLELSSKPVTIGKNKDADIIISGFWSLFAGQPSATINKQKGKYYLDYVTGLIKPKLNGISVTKPALVNHHDIIKIGPIKLQLYVKQ